MRIALGLTGGLLGLAASVFAHDVAIELDKATFPTFINQNTIVLTDFYAPWCGHCQRFSPKFEAAAKELKDFPVKLAKVDCTKDFGLCKEYGISAYPTMKVFKNGKQLYHDYEGPRRVKAIVDFMKKQMLPTVTILTNKQDHDVFLSNEQEEVVLVGYVASSDAVRIPLLYAAAEKLHEDFPIALASDPALAESAGVKFPSFVVHKPDGQPKFAYEGSWEVEELKKFVETSYQPLFGETTTATWSKYVSAAEKPTFFLFANKDDDRKKLVKELRPLAKKYKDDLNFATIELPEMESFARYMHINVDGGADAIPAVGIFDRKKRLRYLPPPGGRLTESKVGFFLQNFLAGSAKPDVLSQHLPPQTGPVTDVSAESFEQVVLDKARDVLILYHRPQCPYCQSLYGPYDILGDMYSSLDQKDKIVIAKMDVQRNDIPDSVPYVPFLKLYKAGEKEDPVAYEGDRSVTDMAAFVRDFGTHKVDALKGQVLENIGQHVTGEGSDGGSQVPVALAQEKLHKQPLQGRTPVVFIHEEL